MNINDYIIPNYRHDCDSCEYLGEFTIESEAYDLYFCPASLMGGSCIARITNDNYYSWPKNLVAINILEFAGTTQPNDQALLEAYKRSLVKKVSETT